MKLLRIGVFAVFGALFAPGAANAHVLHTVAPGETLWSIAAQSNLTTRTVAIYNGLSPESHVVLGSTVKIPSIAEGAAALANAGATRATAAASAPAGSAAASSPLPEHRARRAVTSCVPATRSARSPRRPASPCDRWPT